MYATIASRIRDDSHVFRSIREALDWLEVEPVRHEIESPTSEEACQQRVVSTDNPAQEGPETTSIPVWSYSVFDLQYLQTVALFRISLLQNRQSLYRPLRIFLSFRSWRMAIHKTRNSTVESINKVTIFSDVSIFTSHHLPAQDNNTMTNTMLISHCFQLLILPGL